MITEDVLQVMQRDPVLMLQQNQTHKNDILKVLQVVADRETTPLTFKFSKKRKHKELGITKQDWVQFKMLNILLNIKQNYPIDQILIQEIPKEKENCARK